MSGNSAGRIFSVSGDSLLLTWKKQQLSLGNWTGQRGETPTSMFFRSKVTSTRKMTMTNGLNQQDRTNPKDQEIQKEMVLRHQEELETAPANLRMVLLLAGNLLTKEVTKVLKTMIRLEVKGLVDPALHARNSPFCSQLHLEPVFLTHLLKKK